MKQQCPRMLHYLSIRYLTFIAAIFAIGFALASPAAAQKSGAPDARVANALKEQNIPYKIDSDNNFEVLIKLDNGRSQVVTIESAVMHMKGTSPFRALSSTVMVSDGAVPPAVANRIKRENAAAGMESWIILTYRDRSTSVERNESADADADGETLADLIQTVAEETDALENELTGEDKF
jgi:hypothetical protein